MLETAVILFREGLEAFLVIAIMLAYLTNTGRDDLKKPVYTGLCLALIVSVTTGWHVAELAQDPVWEGSLALIAGIMVATFTVYIMRTAKNIRGNIGAQIQKSADQSGALADIGVFTFAFLMVAREGMETALMLGAISVQENALAMWVGAVAGLGLVAMIGYLWISQSSKINIRLFLQVTGVFLILFAIDLFLYGLHELSEMNAIPLIGENMNINFHIWTEVIETPLVSTLITAALLIVPTAWLGWAFIKDKAQK